MAYTYTNTCTRARVWRNWRIRLPPNVDNYSFKRRDQIINKKSILLFSYGRNSS